MKRAAAGGATALWLLLLPFTIWAAHFVAAYVVAAIYCAKSPDAAAAIDTVRWIVIGVTVIALAALATTLGFGHAWSGKSGNSTGRDPAARDGARFLRSVLRMMSALSALAVLSVAAVVLFFGDCR